MARVENLELNVAVGTDNRESGLSSERRASHRRTDASSEGLGDCPDLIVASDLAELGIGASSATPSCARAPARYLAR